MEWTIDLSLRQCSTLVFHDFEILLNNNSTQLHAFQNTNFPTLALP